MSTVQAEEVKSEEAMAPLMASMTIRRITNREQWSYEWQYLSRLPTKLELWWYSMRGKDPEEVFQRTWREGRGADEEEDLKMAAPLLDKLYDVHAEVYFFSHPERRRNLLTMKLLEQKDDPLTREYFKLTCGVLIQHELSEPVLKRIRSLCRRARVKMEEAKDSRAQELLKEETKQLPHYHRYPLSVKAAMLREEGRWEDAILLTEDLVDHMEPWWTRAKRLWAIPPMELAPSQIETWTKNMVELPAQKRERYRTVLGLDAETTKVLTEDLETALYYEEALECGAEAKEAAKWLTGDMAGYLNNNKKGVRDIKITPAKLAELVKLVESGKITGKIVKELLPELLETWDQGVLDLVKARGMEAITDPAAIEELVNKVLAANADKVAQYRGGKTKLLGFFVGMVIKESGSRADPQLAQDLTERLLNAPPPSA